MNNYYENVPAEIRRLRQWVVWREEIVGDKKSKVPYQSLNPTQLAATTRSREWSTFEEAVNCASDPANGMTGIGFVITKPYIFLDVDHCIKQSGDEGAAGFFNAMAYEYLDLTNSYAEYSHNDGIHILCKGNCPTAAIKPSTHEHVELYTHDRYMAVTGRILNAQHATIRELSDIEANEVYAHAARQKSEYKEQAGNLKLSRDQRFALLMNGEMREAGFTDASAAVHSLLIELACRNDCDQQKMEEQFLLSKLYLETATHWQRKWQRLRKSELERAVTHAKSRSARRSATPDDPNAIPLQDGHINEIVERCETVLTAKDGTADDLGFFSRRRQLMRPIIAKDADEINGVKRDDSAVIIAPASEYTIIRTLAANANFVRPTEKRWVEADPEVKHARHIIDRVASGQATCYRELVIVANCPCLLPSGEVLDEPGYKEGVLYVTNTAVRFPRVPSHPTREDAIAALAQFADIFRECSFVEKIGDACNRDTSLKTASYSAVLAATLSLTARAAVPTIPMTVVNAPTAGSSKSKTIEAICLSSTGQTPATTGYSDEEELRKALLPILMAGDRGVLFDNIDRPLRSATLNTVLTSPGEVTLRLLGHSENISVLNRTVFFATGNGLRIEGDLVRRSVMVSLDTGLEKPQNAEHTFEIVGRARERFPQLVIAALTALRAYHCAGRPDMLGNKVALGNFEEWHRFIVGTLLWCGYKDPTDTQSNVEDNDPEREADLLLLSTFCDEFRDARQTIPDIALADGPTFRVLGGSTEWNPREVAARLHRMAYRPRDVYKMCVDTSLARTKYYVTMKGAAAPPKEEFKPESVLSEETLRLLFDRQP
jgi:putative DNA primase/helicase